MMDSLFYLKIDCNLSRIDCGIRGLLSIQKTIVNDMASLLLCVRSKFVTDNSKDQ